MIRKNPTRITSRKFISVTQACSYRTFLKRKKKRRKLVTEMLVDTESLSQQSLKLDDYTILPTATRAEQRNSHPPKMNNNSKGKTTKMQLNEVNYTNNFNKTPKNAPR